jgi:hypothetical protein
MSPNAPRRKPPQGPRYYRMPSFWGLIFAFVLVILLIWGLSRLR